MNRVQSLQYLTAQYGVSTSPFLVKAGIPLTDTGALGAVIDDALLTLDVAYADLATGDPSNTRGYRATLRYMALRACWANLNQMELIGRLGVGPGISVDSVDWRRMIPTQMAEARAEAAGNGVDLPSGDGSTGWGALDAALGPVGFGLNYLAQDPVVGAE